VRSLAALCLSFFVGGTVTKILQGVFVAGILLLATCCVVWGDVSCSKCKTEVGYSGCANQACQNAEGLCFTGVAIDPETGEEVNTFVGTSSFELVHVADPKFCTAENSSVGASGTDCKGTTAYVCYRKLNYSGLCANRGGTCEEFTTQLGCSVSDPHHNCLVIPQ